MYASGSYSRSSFRPLPRGERMSQEFPSGRNPTRRRLPERCTERKKELFLLHLVVSRSTEPFLHCLFLSRCLFFHRVLRNLRFMYMLENVADKNGHRSESILAILFFFLEIWTSFLEIHTSFSRTNYWLLFRTNLNLLKNTWINIYKTRDSRCRVLLIEFFTFVHVIISRILNFRCARYRR